uniref:THAP-type domain-containing protein n=1 Tax=Daphnia galeata TaxID=27404 RepID=A0A8J2WBZ9_9CRUS|nr:unnamed protein product [Daphnia galeata]
MKKKCFVKCCENKNYGEIILKDVSFHSFPNDENVIDKWTQSLLSNTFETGFSKMEDIKITKSSIICSDHFEKDCFFQVQGYDRFQNHRRLKKNAVPTIFKKKVNTLSQENGFTTCGLDLPRTKVLTAIPHTALHKSTRMCNNKTITSVRKQNTVSTDVFQVY